jgi:RimJ/RimL family protein N-acetyltransferase
MEIRAANTSDLAGLAEIDGTIESAQYLHIERSGEALSTSWRIEERPARQKIIEPNRMSDDAEFQLKQIVSGNDEGIALVIEHDDSPVAMLLAKVDPAAATIRLIDLRVDYDYRRQGMGTALVYQLIQHARESEGVRAVVAETVTNNFPAGAMLAKCGFDMSGVDTRRWSNHDLVKEAATLIWYAALD